MTLKESIGQTKEMYRITMEKNYNFPIPNLDFDFLPVGIDIRKVLKEGVCRQFTAVCSTVSAA